MCVPVFSCLAAATHCPTEREGEGGAHYSQAHVYRGIRGSLFCTPTTQTDRRCCVADEASQCMGGLLLGVVDVSCACDDIMQAESDFDELMGFAMMGLVSQLVNWAPCR